MKQIIKNEKGEVIKVKTVFDEKEQPSLTQQQFKDECDINKIIQKYNRTGQLTHLAKKQGIYADLSKVKDYAQSMQTILDAQNAFMELDSQTRNKFQNDPQKLIEFLQDPKNDPEAIELGLKVAPPAPEPVDTRPKGQEVKDGKSS